MCVDANTRLPGNPGAIPGKFKTIVYLDLFMIFRAFRLFFALGLTVLGLIACGGGAAAPAPTGLKATAAETTVTVSWDMTPGVEYWLFYGPTGKATTEVSSMHGWIGLPGGGSKINVTSPYVVSGLLNGTSYSFSVNGRTDRGPGGPGAAPVSVTPRLAGSS